MSIKQILKSGGWTEEKVSSLHNWRSTTRKVSILRHPTRKTLYYTIQSHELILNKKRIATINSRNVQHDAANNLIIVDDIIAIKVK